MIEGCVAVAAAQSNQISYLWSASLAFLAAPSSLMSQVVSASAATLPWLPSLHTDMAPVHLQNAAEVSGPSSAGQLDMGTLDTANAAAVDGCATTPMLPADPEIGLGSGLLAPFQ